MLQQRLRESDEDYKKRKRRVSLTRMLGFGVGGSIRFLANIIYNMNFFNTTDTNTRTVDNAGSEGVKSDGDMYGSNFIELGAGQSVPLSIPYTLGVEDYTGTSTTSTNITETSLGGGDYNFVATASTDLGDWIKFANTTNTTEQVNEFVFNALINSGTVTFIQYYIGGVKTVLTNPIVITNGENRIVIENDTVFDAIVFVPEELTAWDADFTSISIKQITNPNSFLTTFDYTNKQQQTVDNSLNTPSTTYSQTNDFNMGFSHTTNLEQADHDALNANPNLIYNVWFDSYVLPSGFAKADMVNFYPAGEGELSGEFVQDVSVDLGSQELTNTTWTKTDGTAVSTLSDEALGQFTLDIGAGGTADGRPTVRGVNAGVVTSKKYVLYSDYVVNSGNVRLSRIQFASDSASRVEETVNLVLSGSGSLVYIVDNISIDGDELSFYFSETIGAGNISFTNISLEEVSTSKIINYTASCRTALANQNYGATNHLVKQDATGRAIDLADDYLIEHNGDGRHIDSGFIFNRSEPVTLEIVYYHEADATLTRNGDGVTNFGSNTDNKITLAMGAVAKATTLAKTSGLYHLVGSFNGTTFLFYVNSVVEGTAGTPSTDSTTPFWLGDRSGGTSFLEYNQIGLFKVHKNKAYTQTEVDTAYAAAKLKYPSLP